MCVQWEVELEGLKTERECAQRVVGRMQAQQRGELFADRREEPRGGERRAYQPPLGAEGLSIAPLPDDLVELLRGREFDYNG